MACFATLVYIWLKTLGSDLVKRVAALFVLYKNESVAFAVWMFGCWEQGVASVSLVVRLALYNECFCTHIVD
jgi:hypothetical protein